MIRIKWNPLPHVGPIPINWYGLGALLGFVIASLLVFRWARGSGFAREQQVSWRLAEETRNLSRLEGMR